MCCRVFKITHSALPTLTLPVDFSNRRRAQRQAILLGHPLVNAIEGFVGSKSSFSLDKQHLTRADIMELPAFCTDTPLNAEQLLN